MASPFVLLSRAAIRSPAASGYGLLRRCTPATGRSALADPSTTHGAFAPAAQGLHQYAGPYKIRRMLEVNKAVSNVQRTASNMEKRVGDMETKVKDVERRLDELEAPRRQEQEHRRQKQQERACTGYIAFGAMYGFLGGFLTNHFLVTSSGEAEAARPKATQTRAKKPYR